MAAQVEELRAKLATAEAELIERSREAKAAILAEKERAAEVAAEAASRRGIENRIGSLEAQLDDAASKLKRTEEVLRNVCAERDQFRQRATDNSDNREALKAAEFEISKLRTDAELMQKRVDDAQSRVDPLLAELKETKALLDSLAADRNALASHKSSLEQSSSAVAPLQAEVARLRRRLDELDADNSRLQNALNGAQSAAQAARTAAAASAREADVLRLRLDDALKDKPVILSGRKILTSPKLPPAPPA
jgi:chromosome segregation ATPase